MGLMSFIKGRATCWASAKPRPRSPRVLRRRLRRMLRRSRRRSRRLGLHVDGLKIEVDGDKVKVAGAAADQATKEKLVLALGNVAGVAAVEDHVTVATPAPEAVIYVVKKGDTLSAIAKDPIRRRVEVHGHLRGQQADAEGSRQDLPGPGTPDPAAGQVIGGRRPAQSRTVGEL